MSIAIRGEMKSSNNKDQREKISVVSTRFFQSKTASCSHTALSWILQSSIEEALSAVVSQKETRAIYFFTETL